MPFDRPKVKRDSRYIRFHAAERSADEQDTLQKLATRDDLVAYALQWESVLDPVRIREAGR